MQPRSPTLAFLFLAVSLAAAPLRAQAQDLSTKVDLAVQQHMKAPTTIGLSVGVAYGGEVIAKAYGLANAEFDVRADAETAFRIGSITKQFTAALVLLQIEKGKVALEDPLSKHVPDFPTGGKTVTVRQLLDHTSGIKSYTSLGPEWKKTEPLELSHDELLGLVAKKPFDFEPGTDWSYNNTGYYLLGVLLEKVSGKTYAQLIQDEIATPLGLRRTRYDSNGELIKNRAQGYTFDGDTLRNDAPLGMSQPFAAGALLSTGGELVRWSMALSEGKVVRKASYARMTETTILPSGRNTNYAFGLGRGKFEGKTRIEHGGGINGFRSYLFWLPELALHVAVISNSERVDAQKIAEEIAYEVLGIERPKAEEKPTSPELRALVAGEYLMDGGMTITVFEQNGKLMAQGKGQRASAILWQGELEFRASFDPRVKLVWQKDGKSFELHQGGVHLLRKKE